MPERDGTSIVLLGSFNPRIFQPAWFVRHELLAETEEAAANVEVISNEVSVFETDWFHLEVLSDRLHLTSLATPAPELMRDLLVGTLKLLRHTPVARLGLNTHTHYQLANEDLWHAFGHSMAPKSQLWEPILNAPGTRSLTVEGKREDDKYDGQILVKVEPSYQVPYGIFIEVNDEYRMPESPDAEWVVDVLSERWDESRSRSERVRSHLLEHANRRA